MQPLVAWRAIKRLIANPEATEEVFVIIRALSGPSLERGFRRFKALPVGQRVLEEQRQLVETLKDREKLTQHPLDSLGRAYFEFTKSEQITADGLVEASEAGAETFEDPGLALYGERLRDMHDLWHTVTGYGRDELGEACLLGFTYAQTKNRGVGFITLVAAKEFRKDYGNGALRAIWRGYRDGKRAEWLPGQDWEALLGQPIDAIRRDLRVAEPATYREVAAAGPALA